LKLFRFLIYSNLFISIAAVCLVLQTLLQLNIPVNFKPYISLVFFATLFEYNLHKAITLIGSSKTKFLENHPWLKNNLTSFWIVFYVSWVGLIINLFFIDRTVFLFLIPFGAISIAYSLPLLKHENRFIRLRELPAMKVLFITLVWGMTTVVLPAMVSGISLLSKEITMLLIERMLFVFAITIPFDIRDYEFDKRLNVKTIPVLFGKNNALVIAQVGLLLMLCLCGLYYLPGNRLIFLALALSIFTTWYFIRRKSWYVKPMFYYGLLDGTMIIQFLLVLGATNF